MQIQAPDSIGGYPTAVKSVYDTIVGISGAYFLHLFDTDSDNLFEMIYYLICCDTVPYGLSHQIAKYNIERNKFELVYYHRPPELYTVGYAFGDFDSDGKQNFSIGGMGGKVWIYEHMSGNDYQVNLADSLEITHAYIMTFTNDLDNNGKPELWIGGDNYIGGVGSTSIFLFEASSDDTYEIVYRIDIIGVISFFAGNLLCSDLDKDGEDEVLLCIDQHVLVFKNSGDGYKLYYLKRNELLNQNSVYYSATTADFDNDGYPEIVISMDLEQQFYRRFSRIYKLTKTLGVEENNENVNIEFKLFQNYPNPFNPSTTIGLEINQVSEVLIKIYNILGKEIKLLLDINLPAGEHTVQWDGKDDEGNILPGGVYFIQMTAGDYRQTIKSVLLK